MSQSGGRTKHPAIKNANPPTKKRKGASSSRSPADYDASKFLDAEKEKRFQQLQKWSFIPERKVQLRREEYPEFHDYLTKRKWWTLANPPEKFDPDVVREFYANAYPSSEGGQQFRHASWVRGRRIDYSKESINAYLGSPFNSEWTCFYQYRKSKSKTLVHGFNIEETTKALCIRGKSYETGHDGQPMRILRKNMTTLAQTWMMFMLHNLAPNSHVSSLPMEDCHMLYFLFGNVKFDVAQVITEFIYKTATKGGIKGTLGLPALITALCECQGVHVNYSESIKPPITRKYITHYFKEEHQPPPLPQQPQQPAPQPQLSLDERLAQMTLHMEHIEDQNNMLRQGQIHQQQAFYAAAQHYMPGQHLWMHPDEFVNAYPWPGVRPTFPGGEGSSGTPNAEHATQDAGDTGSDEEEDEGEDEDQSSD